MSARGFGSVLWAGAVAGAALGFYLVSLNVASERAELENVETRIALAQRDIRLLQTEIGTRGRLAQLERWNVKFIRLSAPTADQFVERARSPLRPPMPWFNLRDMRDGDVKAIYAYLKHLGPAGEPAPPYLPPDQEPKGPYVTFPAPPK